MAARYARRRSSRYRRGPFENQPKRLWYHRYQNRGVDVASLNTYYLLASWTGVDDSVKLLKDIYVDIDIAPALDSAPPYARSNFIIAWVRRPRLSSLTDISDDDSLRVWRPRVVAVNHQPGTPRRNIVMRWPRLMLSEDDVFELVIWADARGMSTYVSSSAHYMEAEHQGPSAAITRRLEKLEAASSPPSVAPNVE